MNQKQAVTLAASERDWHLKQLLAAPLTEHAREYHRDLISWLEQHYDLCRSGVSEPAVEGSPAARRKRCRRTPRRRFHRRQAGQAG